MLFRCTCKLVEFENATKALEKAKPKNQEMVRFWQTCALHMMHITLVPLSDFVMYMWLSVFFHMIHVRLHLAKDSKFKLSLWLMMVNARIEES